MSNRGVTNFIVLHAEGDVLRGRILRRIVCVEVVVHTHPPERRVTLNCGHYVNVARSLRPTVGKLTPCPRCI